MVVQNEKNFLDQFVRLILVRLRTKMFLPGETLNALQVRFLRTSYWQEQEKKSKNSGGPPTLPNQNANTERKL